MTGQQQTVANARFRDGKLRTDPVHSTSQPARMPIDTSGKWWKGSTPEDVGEYLQALSAESYAISDFRVARCPCGGDSFRFEVERDEGIAKRTCVACETEHFLCDSAENFEPGMRLKKFKCVCKAVEANLGAGFSPYEGSSEIRWLWVGHRCVACGVLGSMVDWRIGFEPSGHLPEQV